MASTRRFLSPMLSPMYASTPMNHYTLSPVTLDDLSVSVTSLGVTMDLLEQESSHGLVQNLAYLLKHEQSMDVIFLFESEDKKLKAHKNILAADSVVFNTEFYAKMEEQSTHIVVQNITDVSYANFRTFIETFYKTNIPVSDENIRVLMQLGHRYKARNCIFFCHKYLKRTLGLNNVWLVYELTLEHGYEQLANQCKTMIGKDFSKAIALNGFVSCPKDVVMMVLKQRIPKRNEIEVFKAMVKWAEHRCISNGNTAPSRDDLQQELEPFLKLIRFSEMEPDDLIACQSQYKILDLIELNQIFDAIVKKKDEKNKKDFVNRKNQNNPDKVNKNKKF